MADFHLPGQEPLLLNWLGRVTHVTETFDQTTTVTLETLTDVKVLTGLSPHSRQALYQAMDEERLLHPTRTTDYVITKQFQGRKRNRPDQSPCAEKVKRVKRVKRVKQPAPVFIVQNSTNTVLTPFSAVASLFWSREEQKLTVVLTGNSANVTAQMSESEFAGLQNRFLVFHGADPPAPPPRPALVEVHVMDFRCPPPTTFVLPRDCLLEGARLTPAELALLVDRCATEDVQARVLTFLNQTGDEYLHFDDDEIMGDIVATVHL